MSLKPAERVDSSAQFCNRGNLRAGGLIQRLICSPSETETKQCMMDLRDKSIIQGLVAWSHF